MNSVDYSAYQGQVVTVTDTCKDKLLLHILLLFVWSSTDLLFSWRQRQLWRIWEICTSNLSQLKIKWLNTTRKPWEKINLGILTLWKCAHLLSFIFLLILCQCLEVRIMTRDIMNHVQLVFAVRNCRCSTKFYRCMCTSCSCALEPEGSVGCSFLFCLWFALFLFFFSCHIVKKSVKNNENCPLQPLFVLPIHAFFLKQAPLLFS